MSKRYFCSHCNDFVSRGTRSRHLRAIAATKERHYDSDSELESSNETCAFAESWRYQCDMEDSYNNSDGEH